MIVDSMTYEEVYQELAKDRESVTTWWRHQLYDQRRRALKCTRWPMHIWREYTSQRKNRYVFFSRVFDKRMRCILTGVVAVRHTSEGMTVYATWVSDHTLIRPIVLLPHAWKRYTERVGVAKHGIELIKHYFLRNPYGKDSENQAIVGRSVRYNGEDHLSCCVPEGIILGQLSGNIFVARTFITYDMCCGRQKKEFEACRSQLLTDREMYDAEMRARNYT